MPADNPLGVPTLKPSNLTSTLSSLAPTNSKPLTGRPRSTLTSGKQTQSLYNRSTSPIPSGSSNHPTLRTHSSEVNAGGIGGRGNYPGSIVAGSSNRIGGINSVHNLQHSKHDLNSSNNQPKIEDLDRFNNLCIELYFNKDSGAAKIIDQTLNKLPVVHKTAYAKVMNRVRQEFHAYESNRRLKLVDETLAKSTLNSKIVSTLKISSVDTPSLKVLRSKQARSIRLKSLKEFLSEHCTNELIGTHPVLRSLYAALYLQSLPEAKGGAGRRAVEWKVDTVVFIEAGGGSWMEDSIELLKSVLGFEESVPEVSPQSYFDEEEEEEERIPIISTPPTQPSSKRPPPTIPPHRPAVGSLRHRSLSDPFLLSDPFSDPKDKAPTSLGPLSPPSPSLPTSEINPGPSTPFLTNQSPPRANHTSTIRNNQDKSTSISPIRIFTLPSHLTDPELKSLCNTFPSFITSRAKASIITPSNPITSLLDEESVVALPGGEGIVKVSGHGQIRIGSSLRSEGYRGTLWNRFIIWFVTFFHCFGRR